jgi:hypothetical protein
VNVSIEILKTKSKGYMIQLLQSNNGINLLGEVLNNIFKLCQDNGAMPEDWKFAVWREKRRANMSDLNGSSAKFDVSLKSYQIIVTFPKYFKAFCIPKP